MVMQKSFYQELWERISSLITHQPDVKVVKLISMEERQNDRSSLLEGFFSRRTEDEELFFYE